MENNNTPPAPGLAAFPVPAPFLVPTPVPAPFPAPFAVPAPVPVPALAGAAQPRHDDQMMRSIEVPKEPRTLSAAELQAFRERTFHIINTHGPEEAARIFMEGYKPPIDPRPQGSSIAKICRKRTRSFR